MSPVSSSVAPTAFPISTPEPVFSATERVALSPSVNTGADVSTTSVTLIVMSIVSSSAPSETVILTE